MSVFEEACYLSNQRWVSSFPAEFEPVHFSKQHQRRMNILFDKMRRDKYHRFTKRVTMALIAAAIVISMTITAFAIPATRDFIIRHFFDHSTYAVLSGEHNAVSEIKIGYIPEGFEKTYEYLSDEQMDISYEEMATNTQFEIRKMSLNFKTDFDTEQYYHEEYVYNGIKYIYYIGDDKNIGCIWNNGKYAFAISGNLSKEELLKIAYSIAE